MNSCTNGRGSNELSWMTHNIQCRLQPGRRRNFKVDEQQVHARRHQQFRKYRVLRRATKRFTFRFCLSSPFRRRLTRPRLLTPGNSVQFSQLMRPSPWPVDGCPACYAAADAGTGSSNETRRFTKRRDDHPRRRLSRPRGARSLVLVRIGGIRGYSAEPVSVRAQEFRVSGQDPWLPHRTPRIDVTGWSHAF